MQVLAPAKESTAADACARAMLDGLPPVMWFIRRNMRKSRTAGLSVPQFRALCLIDRYPTVGLSIVAEHLGCSQPAASRLIQGLVGRGFVERREGREDRRQIALALTPSGRSSLTAARNATQKRLAEEVGHLPESQRKTIVAAMTMLRGVFESKTLKP
jgi:DNA-binding MarR family transcriptional regulator